MSSVVVLSTVDSSLLRERLERVASTVNAALTAYQSIDELLEHSCQSPVGLAVLEVGLCPTPQLTRWIADLAVCHRVVLMGKGVSLSLAVAAMNHGSVDVLELDEPFEPALLRHLQEEVAYLARISPVRERVSMLSNREREVVNFMLDGSSVKEVAMRLQISPKTASEHVAKVLSKLRVENTTQLVRLVWGTASASIDPRLRGWLRTYFSREHL